MDMQQRNNFPPQQLAASSLFILFSGWTGNTHRSTGSSPSFLSTGGCLIFYCIFAFLPPPNKTIHAHKFWCGHSEITSAVFHDLGVDWSVRPWTARRR
ncbi:hypothetical protein BDV11DRAFT_91544 [Aspergillus similis]